MYIEQKCNGICWHLSRILLCYLCMLEKVAIRCTGQTMNFRHLPTTILKGRAPKTQLLKHLKLSCRKPLLQLLNLTGQPPQPDHKHTRLTHQNDSSKKQSEGYHSLYWCSVC